MFYKKGHFLESNFKKLNNSSFEGYTKNKSKSVSG